MSALGLMEGVRLAGVAPIVTERLVLRAPEARDVAPYVAYRTGARAAFIGGGPCERGAAEAKFAGMIGQWVVRGYGRYVIALGHDEPGVGHVGLLADPGTCGTPEMTWTLWDDGHSGRGHATEAARAILTDPDVAARWPSLPAYVAPGNARSRRLAERLGGVIDRDAQPPQRCAGALTYRLTCAA